MTFIERYVDLMDRITYEALPADVLRQTKICCMDLAECVLACDEDDPRMRSALASIETQADGLCALWGTALRSAPADAAFYNAVRGAMSYRNSLHRASGTHPVEIAAAAVMAGAAKQTVSTEDRICGLICGIETIARMGGVLKSLQLPPSNRTTAMCAAMGAAVAAGKAMHLSGDELCSALSFATHFASGNNQWGNDGTGEDIFQAGWGARNGYLAARLAAAGATGTKYAFEGKDGLIASLGRRASASALQAALSLEWRCLQLESKPIDGCMMIQTPAQLMEDMLRSRAIRPEEVSRICVRVCGQALSQAGCDSLEIRNSVQAKMNIRYAVASVLVYGRIRDVRWKPPFDNRVLCLMQRIELAEKPGFTSAFPKKVSAEIAVDLQDGTMLCREQEDFISLDREELMRRLLRLAEQARTDDAVQALLRDLDSLIKNEEECHDEL